jgi:hypothetical protein
MIVQDLCTMSCTMYNSLMYNVQCTHCTSCKMTNFITLFLLKVFLKISLLVIAPKVGLQYIASMQWNRVTNKYCFWCQHLVLQQTLLEISTIKRTAMAPSKLYETQKVKEIKPWKQAFPKVNGDNTPSTVSLIGPRSQLSDV